jgi:hypothetical protein
LLFACLQKADSDDEDFDQEADNKRTKHESDHDDDDDGDDEQRRKGGNADAELDQIVSGFVTRCGFLVSLIHVHDSVAAKGTRRDPHIT